MAESTIVMTDAPDRRDVEVIGQGLAVYNHEQTGIHDHKPLAVLVKDADGNTLGGISGRSSLGLLFLDLVYLPKTLRGGGVANGCWRSPRRRAASAAASGRCSTPSASRRRSSTKGMAGACSARFHAIRRAPAGSS